MVAMGHAALPHSIKAIAQPRSSFCPLQAVVPSPHDSGFCRRDPDAFGSQDETSEAGSQCTEQADANRLSSHVAATPTRQGIRPPYIISQPVPSDPELSGLLLEKLQAAATEDASILQGLNVSADSFYSSQVHCTGPVHVIVDVPLMGGQQACLLSSIQPTEHLGSAVGSPSRLGTAYCNAAAQICC